MQTTSDHLAYAVQQKLTPIYIFHGDEELLIQEGLDHLRQAVKRTGYNIHKCLQIQNTLSDWGKVIHATNTLDLFADKQLLEFHSVSPKPIKEGIKVLQTLSKTIQLRAQTLVVIFIFPRLDKTVKNSTWFTALEKVGTSIQVDKVKPHQFPGWINQRLRACGLQLKNDQEGQNTLQFLVNHVEGNLQAAHQEIEKLALLYPGGRLSLKEVSEAVLNVARYNVFDLTIPILSGHLHRAQAMLTGLRGEGTAEVLVHWVLSEEILLLKRVLVATQNGRPLTVVLQEQRVWGAKVRLYEKMLTHVNQGVIAKWLQSAYQVDSIIKGVRLKDWPYDPWLALQRLVTQMTKVFV